MIKIVKNGLVEKMNPRVQKSFLFRSRKEEAKALGERLRKSTKEGAEEFLEDQRRSRQTQRIKRLKI